MWFKSLYHLAEAALVFLLYGFFRLLPLDVASWFGGWVARIFGPLTRVHRTAAENISKALPELSKEERQRTLRDMWDNLGRSVGEYPHLNRPIIKTRITITGGEHIQTVKQSGKATLLISGHFGNIEIMPASIHMLGLPLILFYRPANNPYIDRAIRKIRAEFNNGMYPKGREAARNIVRAIKNKLTIGMLVDQKTNTGIPVPFFGRDAMTASASAEYGLKYKLPVLPVREIRTQGAHFEVMIFPPMIFADTGDYEKDVLVATTGINKMFEDWIREYPAQWFWVHNRWPKDA